MYVVAVVVLLRRVEVFTLFTRKRCPNLAHVTLDVAKDCVEGNIQEKFTGSTESTGYLSFDPKLPAESAGTKEGILLHIVSK